MGGVKGKTGVYKKSEEHKLRFAINNGRTLCVSCHKTTDNYGGKCKNDKRTI